MNVPAETGDQPTLVKIPDLPQSEAAAAINDFGGADPAQREVASLSLGLSRKRLEEQAVVAEHGRSERFRNNFENLAIFALWMSALSISAIGIVWLAHMIMPVRYRWLSNEDLSHIQSIVTAGLLVGVIGNHFKKRLGSSAIP